MSSLSSSQRGALYRLVLVALVLGVAALLAARAGWFDYRRVAAWAVRLRARHDAPPTILVFLGIWTGGTALGFPALPLVVAGGALFGTALGVVLSLAGTALGALGGYAFARLAAPDLVKRWVARRLPINRFPGRGHFLTLLRLRLLPLVPFTAVNYAAGLARVPIGPYLASTLLGQLPSTLLYSFFADRLLRSVDRGAGAVAREAAILSGILLLLSLVPTLLRRRARTRPWPR